MHNPKFSIITVCFNAETTIERTLHSVASQSYRNAEYIVIDGASKDNTLKILQKYQDHITHLVSEPDNGLYYAMNKAIRLASGDYLCFLNAGDCLYSDTTLADIAESIPDNIELPDIIYGETAIVDINGNYQGMRRLHTPEQLTWKSFKNGMVVCHQAFFANRRLVEEYNTQYRFSADVDWCIRIMKKSKILFNTHLTLINYLNQGLTTENSWKSLKERFRIMTRHYGITSTVVHHIGFIFRTIFH